MRRRLPLSEHERRRVLILLENAPAPSDRRVGQESRTLFEAGYEVVVISPSGEVDDREPYEHWHGIEIHRFPLRAAGRGTTGYVREYIGALWKMARLVRRLTSAHRFGIVHACNPPDFLLALALPLRHRGARLVFDHHDLAPELYEARFGKRGLYYRALLVLERFAFAAADVVISTNESYRRVAIERGRKRPSEVFVVRNGPDPEHFRPTPSDDTMKRGRRHLLVYLGTMGPQDGVDLAIRALAHLRLRRADWLAVFMGDGEELERLQTLARDLGLADAVEFLGRVADDRIIPVLSAADVCLAPEPSNPFNDRSTIVKVLEYMAMARPVVAFDLPETRVSAEHAALYAPSGDVAAFAGQIARLLDDPALRTTLGERGRDRVVQELGWHRSRDALLRAYAALSEG
jgi:glycosyltransferase involved in cell wall biosynthesis